MLRVAAGRAGLDTAGARLVHSGAGSVFRLSGGVVAEICGPESLPGARHLARVGRWLCDSGVGVVRPPRDVSWLLEVDDHAVSFREEPLYRPGDYRQIATALRRLHALVPPDDLGLAPVDPFRRVAARVGATPLISTAEREGLLARLRHTRAAYAQLPPGLAHTPLHGDAWAGNIVALADGSVVLRDLERVSIGPPEWDLVSTVIDHTTFGAMSDEEYRQFSEAYGHDVLGWAGCGTLLAARELRVVAFALAAAEETPHLVAQAQLRVRALLAGERPWPGWQPL